MPNKIKKVLLNIIESDVPDGYDEQRAQYIMYQSSKSNVSEEEINDFVSKYCREELFDEDDMMYVDKNDGYELFWDERVDLALKAFQEKHKGVIIEKVELPKFKIYCD